MPTWKGRDPKLVKFVCKHRSAAIATQVGILVCVYVPYWYIYIYMPHTHTTEPAWKQAEKLVKYDMETGFQPVGTC